MLIDNKTLCLITYGSHLYGTNTATSDTDYKSVTLPTIDDLLLHRKLSVKRLRFTDDGQPVDESAPMPDNGWEAEIIPVHKFVGDFLSGQAYAVEMAFAVQQGKGAEFSSPHLNSKGDLFKTLCNALCTTFLHKNVNGMVGFAVKQTFDYVRRGERLNAAKDLLQVIDRLLVALDTWKTEVRLDTPFMGTKVLDFIVESTGLETGTSLNHDREIRTLKLNGREYLETTALAHLRGAVQKLADSYGERSTKASETDVDWKSLSHAVRVYQQVIELLSTGTVSFPRPNAAELLKIKLGQEPIELVKRKLAALDDAVMKLQETTTLPAVDEPLTNNVYAFFLKWLRDVYGLREL